MAVSKTLKFEKRADFEFAFRWLDEEGQVVPLEDVAMQVRLEMDDADPVVDVSLGDGIVIDVDGWVRILVPRADLDAIDIGEAAVFGAVYDIVVTKQGGAEKRLFEGGALISEGVTR